MTERNIPMLEALHATQPNEALASKLHLYGHFVGCWQLDIDYQALDGSTHRAEGEWHFSWVLDGGQSKTCGSDDLERFDKRLIGVYTRNRLGRFARVKMCV